MKSSLAAPLENQHEFTIDKPASKKAMFAGEFQQQTTITPVYSLPALNSLSHSSNNTYSGIDAHNNYLSLLGGMFTYSTPENGLTEIKLTGTKGVGKTTLALAFGAQEAETKEHDLIYFLNSGTEGELLKGYKELLHRLHVNVQEETSSNIYKLVKEHISLRKKWLLIYDNVSDPHFLINKTPQKGGYILITSQWNQGWKGLTLNIDPFNNEEVPAYLLKPTGLFPTGYTFIQWLQAKCLGEELQALLHATNSMEIFDSLKPFSYYPQKKIMHIKNLVNSSTKSFKNNECTYIDFIETRLNFLRDGLTPFAKMLLLRTAYLDADHILPEIFIDESSSAQEVKEAFAELKDCYLIKSRNSFFTMHRFLQLIIRNEFETKYENGVLNLFMELHTKSTRLFMQLCKNVDKLFYNHGEKQQYINATSMNIDVIYRNLQLFINNKKTTENLNKLDQMIIHQLR